MPGFDGTGPNGLGPMTGGGRGMCSGAGLGRRGGRGRGMGRGLGRGYRGGRGPENAVSQGSYSAEEKLIALKREAAVLREQMNETQSIIDSLEKQLKDKE